MCCVEGEGAGGLSLKSVFGRSSMYSRQSPIDFRPSELNVGTLQNTTTTGWCDMTKHNRSGEIAYVEKLYIQNLPTISGTFPSLENAHLEVQLLAT